MARALVRSPLTFPAPIALTPNAYAPAAQFSWLLQFTADLTLACAMAALAARLRRPALRAMAAAWIVHSLVAFDNYLFFRFPTVKEGWPDVLNLLLPWALGGSLVAFYGFAARSVAGLDPAPRVPWRRVWAWMAAFTVAGAFIEYSAALLWAGDSRTSMVTSRLTFALTYIVSAAITYRAMRSSPTSRKWLWPLMGAQVFRVCQLGIDLSLRLKSVSTGLDTSEQGIVVSLQLLALILLGLASASVGLEQERSVVLDQERRLYAAQLSATQSERMESLGRLAGGVAHDFNNLLTVILTSAQDTLAENPRDESMRAIVDSAERGAQLTRQLMNFARGQPTAPRRLIIADAVRQMEPLLQRLVEKSHVLQFDLESDRAVMMDPSQFEQVLMNLAVNARDAMPGGGTLTVALDAVDLSDATSIIGGVLQPGPYARLSVSDTGVGMSPEVIARAFDPFYTTKGVTGGSGLGLATVLSAVRQAMGDVRIESRPGEGARFEILLPAIA